MKNIAKTALLHYSAAPIVGGVESVLNAHAKVFLQEGYPVSIIAGSGEKSALPKGTAFIHLPLMNSQNKQILKVNKELEKGLATNTFYDIRTRIESQLEDRLRDFDNVIVHNIFSKHFNLPLTDALHQLLDKGKIKNCIGWCHDFSWTSPRAKPLLHNGHPWNLLRTYREEIQFVVVSKKRQKILAEILDIPQDNIQVIYNGIGPKELMGVDQETNMLIKRLGLDSADLVILMPVRITRAKNIEFAMQMVANLLSTVSNPQLILTGPPDPHDPENAVYYEQLKHMRTELGIENNFRFMYEENPKENKPYILDMNIVGDLYRVSDLVFIPSHREGFGMPVLEAGFSGRPVFSTRIPAAEEIGGADIHFIDVDQGAKKTADIILNWALNDSIHQFRVKTRQKFTWINIFREQIQPLLVE